MSFAQNLQVSAILTELEHELRNQNLWSSERPDETLFMSDQPFFMDKMEFHEWLQFVLIEKFRIMIFEQQELPQNVKLFPYAYEIYKSEMATKSNLLKIIHKLDHAFNK